MKQMLLAFCATLVFNGGLLAQDELPAPTKGPFKNVKDQTSYAIGVNFGKNMAADGIALNVDLIIQGIRDAITGKKTLLNDEDVSKSILIFERQVAEKRKKDGEAFLAANGKKQGVVTLSSGLQYKVLKSGNGATPRIIDRIKAHYRGSLTNGVEFDSSIRRGQPAVFPVRGVIRGWTEALLRMKVGDKWRLFVPSEMAYGERGFPPAIGPNAVLIFEIELLEIQK